jgi:hypothetical protein
MIFTIKMAMFAYVLADFDILRCAVQTTLSTDLILPRGTEVRAKRSENDKRV